jgi:hypothetical protein
VADRIDHVEDVASPSVGPIRPGQGAGSCRSVTECDIKLTTSRDSHVFLLERLPRSQSVADLGLNSVDSTKGRNKGTGESRKPLVYGVIE